MSKQASTTPNLSLMSDREYCRYMIGQVEEDLSPRVGYIARVQELAKESDVSVTDQQIIQTRTGRLFNRTIAYLIHCAGLLIRAEAQANAAQSSDLYAVAKAGETK